MADLGTTVFARIFPQNREALDYALERLTIDHFRDGIHRTFWKVLAAFGERYGDVFPAQHLTDLLQRNGIEATKALLYAQTYELYATTEVSDSAFRYAVDGLRSDLDKFQTGNVITTAFEILEEGRDIDGEFLSGHEAAREYFYTHSAEIEERSRVEEAPEGDMRAEGDRLRSLYTEREGMEELPGIQFGIKCLDDATNGVQAGEMALLAAFTSEGKSMLLAQTAWNACVMQGRNVFIATSETVRDTMMRRILARHSRLPKFGLPQGLNAKAIQNGTLTKEQREVYFAVIEDFTTNPDIGLCHVSQLTSGATLRTVDQRVSRVNRTHPVELVAVDYFQLLKAQTKRGSEREEFNEILRDFKVWAPAFDHGRGVAVVSPWQMSREAYKAALTTAAYTTASLSDTSEAEKSADLLISLLRPSATSSEGLLQILKNRDGPTLGPQTVHIDYRSTYLGDSATVSTSVGALATDDVFDLDGVLGGA